MSCMAASFIRQGGRMISCRGAVEEYTACVRQPVCARSHDRCYLAHATPAGEGGHRVRQGETSPGRHARLEYVLRGRCPAVLSLRGHGRKTQGRRSRATRSCDGWRQAAPPAPRWATAARGSRQRQAAATQGRRARAWHCTGRGNAAILSRSRSAPASARWGPGQWGYTGGGFIKTKFLLKSLRRE
jgi:hypothetical protein